MNIYNLFQKYIPGRNVICPLCEERPVENSLLCKDYVKSYKEMDKIDRENERLTETLRPKSFWQKRRLIKRVRKRIDEAPAKFLEAVSELDSPQDIPDISKFLRYPL